MQPSFDPITLNWLDWMVLFGLPLILLSAFLAPKPYRDLLELWIPRALIGLSIVLLVYFTQRAYRFKGTYDDSFLDLNNLNLVRGPLATEEYYKRGLPDYHGSPLFSATGEADISIPAEGLAEELPQSATTTNSSSQ